MLAWYVATLHGLERLRSGQLFQPASTTKQTPCQAVPANHPALLLAYSPTKKSTSIPLHSLQWTIPTLHPMLNQAASVPSPASYSLPYPRTPC